jgi:general secretion pathway protein E
MIKTENKIQLDDLLKYDIDYSLVENISIKNSLKKYKIMPVIQNSLYLLVASSDINQDIQVVSDIFHLPIKFINVSLKSLEFEWQYLEFKIKLFNLAMKSIENSKDKTDENLYIIQFIDNLFNFTIDNGVSDIHFEVLDKSFIIRCRIDGILNQIFRFNIKLYPIISSIVKFLALLDISQKRLPLDGRFSRVVNNYTYDFRVSTLPTIYGESIVIRILDNKNIQKKLKDIGFNKNNVEMIENILNLTAGMILVTGPTGSGKTTTLYSMLNFLNTKEKKIITIEDPVEYKIDGIIQVNINNDINLDYQTVLKNILRQDPDILMIGEIRDKISLQMAIQASLTGHLVIATLHTNSALETITRLLDMDTQRYLIASTLKLVISQRLVRVLCDKCKIFDSVLNSYVNKGCQDCNLNGFNGRQIVSEILKIDNNISQMISKEATILDILEYAELSGFKKLEKEGLFLVENGTTTIGEYYSKI